MVGAVDVADVLGALEYPEGKAGQEIARREETSCRPQSESRVLLQEIADLLQLRYAMGLEDSLLLQLLEDSLILDAGVLRHQVQHGVEDARPSLVLRLGVWNARYRIAVLVSEGDLSDDLATSAVFLVGEAGMVHVQIRLVLGHQMVAVVEVGRVAWEPRVLDADGVVGQQSHAVQSRALTQVPDELQQALPGHVDLHEHLELQTLLLGGSRFHVGDRALKVLDGLQDPTQRANALPQSQHQSRLLHAVLAFRQLRYGLGQHHFLLGESGICDETFFVV